VVLTRKRAKLHRNKEYLRMAIEYLKMATYIPQYGNRVPQDDNEITPTLALADDRFYLNYKYVVFKF